jgi:hypothetical protein
MSANRGDPGQGSGPSRYPGTFLLAVREALAGLNWQIRRLSGGTVECVDAQGREQTIGLENIYRRARREDHPLTWRPWPTAFWCGWARRWVRAAS